MSNPARCQHEFSAADSASRLLPYLGSDYLSMHSVAIAKCSKCGCEQEQFNNPGTDVTKSTQLARMMAQ